MSQNTQSDLDFLREVPFFSAFSQTALEELSNAFHEIEIPEGEIIFSAGESSDGVFIIRSGSVRLDFIEERSGETAKHGEVIGVEGFFKQEIRNATATVLKQATVLFLDVQQIERHLLANDDFIETLTVIYNSKKLIKHVPMPWLQDDESVNLMTRKHPIFLLIKSILPILTFSTIVVLANLWADFQAVKAMTALLIAFLICLLWLIWNINNWANDFYLITNKRMIWVERVSGLYDSRQEAPLGTLVSVGIKTSQIGAFLGYSDVIVRTYIGDIRFERVAHAKIIGKLIESYWSHAKKLDIDFDAQEIRKVIRQKFGKEPDEISSKEFQEELGLSQNDQAREIGFFEWLFSDFLKVRYEAGGTITYRKHWFVLLRKTVAATLVIGLASYFLIGVITRNITFMDYSMSIITSAFVILVFLSIWLYQYIDWRNDIFQLTPSQVIDTDRKPFGRESRRSAPLENILSIEYERRGVIPMLFNFGTVYITVGNSQLTFNHVHQPSNVQQDIFTRMGAKTDEKEKRLTEQERERIARWFKVYHEETQITPEVWAVTKPLNPPK